MTEAKPLYLLRDEEQRWLAGLTVGAAVCVTFRGKSFPAQVTHITKSRRVRVLVPEAAEGTGETWEFSSDGWIRGAFKAQDVQWRLMPTEDELRAIVAHRERCQRLTKTRWAELPQGVVAQVMALLEKTHV